jgi:hypothetical protein
VKRSKKGGVSSVLMGADATERTNIQNNQNLADLDFFSISKLDANANSPGYIIPVRRNSLLKLSEYAWSSQQELRNFCAGQSSRIIKNSTSLNKLRKINSQNNKTEIMKKCTETSCATVPLGFSSRGFEGRKWLIEGITWLGCGVKIRQARAQT